jgi:hypothetical protein
MAKLSDFLPLLLLLSESIKNAKARKVIAATPLVAAIRSRFRLAFINGRGVELTAEEVQQLGDVLNLK